MKVDPMIQSQYFAALEMLKSCIQECPEDLWFSQEFKNRSWHITFHALFYTHLYLQPTEGDFKPWEKHKDEFSSLQNYATQTDHPYTQEEMLEYLAFCQQQVKDIVPKLDLEAESGFYWLPFTKLELQFYNIRHIQLHMGELAERLGQAGIDIGWVGMVSPE